MLLKNNSAHGSPLRYLGGGVNAPLTDACRREGRALPNRCGFGPKASVPSGYRPGVALVAALSDGGLAGWVRDAIGSATNTAAMGRGFAAATLTAVASAQGYAYGAIRIAGESVGVAAAAWSGTFGRGVIRATVEIGSRPSAFDVASEIMDVQLIEPGMTLRKALRLLTAVSAGKISGAAGSTITIRNVPDTKDRVVAGVDANGNRLTVTTDLS